MAWQAIGALLKDDKDPLLDEGDVKRFAERYFREKLKNNTLYCREVRGGQVWMRVGSPTLQQEAYLLEYDARQAFKQELNYKLKSLKVTR